MHHHFHEIKFYIFWEGHKILRNLHRRFDPYYIGQIYGGVFSKICGLIRKYELYKMYERLNWHLLKVDQELFGIKRRYRWRHPLKVWKLFLKLKWSVFLILVLGLTIVKVPPVEIEFEYYQKLDVVRQSSSNLWVEGDFTFFFQSLHNFQTSCPKAWANPI